MKKILLLLFVLVSMQAFALSPEPAKPVKVAVAAKPIVAVEHHDTMFFSKHFYWHFRNVHYLAEVNNDKDDELGIVGYFQVCFWFTVIFSLLLIIIVFLVGIGNTQRDFEMGHYGWLYFILHLFYFAIIFTYGIFLANVGPVWFGIVGFITCVILGITLSNFHMNIVLPILQTFYKNKTTKNNFKTKYNQIKNQKPWNQ